MKNVVNYPLIDEYMTYDYTTHHYVLTEQAADELLATSLRADFTNATQNGIAQFLRQISMQVYRYIHQFSMNNALQDFIIAKTKSGRDIIRRAMEQQLIYVISVGDLSRSPKESERKLWFDQNAADILEETIPEIGTTILYNGCGLCFRTCDTTKW